MRQYPEIREFRVRASLVQALANVSLAMQDLVLAYEMLYDLGA